MDEMTPPEKPQRDASGRIGASAVVAGILVGIAVAWGLSWANWFGTYALGGKDCHTGVVVVLLETAALALLAWWAWRTYIRPVRDGGFARAFGPTVLAVLLIPWPCASSSIIMLGIAACRQ